MKSRRPALADMQQLLAAADPTPQPGSPEYEAKVKELAILMAAGLLAAHDARLSGDVVRAKEIESAVREAVRRPGPEVQRTGMIKPGRRRMK